MKVEKRMIEVNELILDSAEVHLICSFIEEHCDFEDQELTTDRMSDILGAIYRLKKTNNIDIKEFKFILNDCSHYLENYIDYLNDIHDEIEEDEEYKEVVIQDINFIEEFIDLYNQENIIIKIIG